MRKFKLKAVYEEGPDYATTPIKGSRHAVQTFEDKLQLVSEPEEMMYLITLDTRHCPTSYTEVARGSLNETIVHPREIFKAHSVPGDGVGRYLTKLSLIHAEEVNGDI